MKLLKTRTAAIGLVSATVLAGALAAAAPAEAQPSGGSGAAIGKTDTETLSGKARTSVSAAGTTFDWGSKRGWWILNLNGLPVSAGRAVTVSATEVDAAGNEFIGSAPMYCQNVAVTLNRVSARCFIDWPNPIRVRLHYVY